MKFELTFKVVLLFSYQGFVLFFFDTTSLFYHFQKSLSRTFLFYFCCFLTVCIFQHFLLKMSRTFLRLYSQRRRRDLNPCAATNDLLTFQASPFGLLGTSPNSQQNLFKEDVQTNDFLFKQMIRRRWDSNPRYLSVSLVFKTSSLNHSDTSPYVFILFRSRKRLTYIITSICICQQLFSIFFIFLICFFNRRKVGKETIYKMLRFAAYKLLSRNLYLL